MVMLEYGTICSQVVEKQKKRKIADAREEPLRGLTIGGPGTGKSRVIQWIVRLFTEGMGWEEGCRRPG